MMKNGQNIDTQYIIKYSIYNLINIRIDGIPVDMQEVIRFSNICLGVIPKISCVKGDDQYIFSIFKQKFFLILLLKYLEMNDELICY